MTRLFQYFLNTENTGKGRICVANVVASFPGPREGEKGLVSTVCIQGKENLGSWCSLVDQTLRQGVSLTYSP